MIILAILVTSVAAIFYSAYNADYNAVKGVTVQMSPSHRFNSSQPIQQIRFDIYVYIYNEKPAWEATAINGIRFSLTVDLQPRVDSTVPYNSAAGG